MSCLLLNLVLISSKAEKFIVLQFYDGAVGKRNMSTENTESEQITCKKMTCTICICILNHVKSNINPLSSIYLTFEFVVPLYKQKLFLKRSDQIDHCFVEYHWNEHF